MAGLILEKRDHLALLTISNPPANTWTKASLELLEKTVHELNEDRSITVLILRGEGEKFFSAGADLNMFAAGEKTVAKELSDVFGRAFTALANFRGVSIAAVNGFAMGGGLEAAMACDFRIVEEQSLLALPEAKVGLLPCGLGTQTLTRLVGESWAKRMILLGERVDANTALSIGLADEVCPKGEAMDSALSMARKSLSQSPVAIAKCKQLIQGTRSDTMDKVLEDERAFFVDLFDYQDTTEGVNAFLEKRPANWENK